MGHPLPACSHPACSIDVLRVPNLETAVAAASAAVCRTPWAPRPQAAATLISSLLPASIRPGAPAQSTTTAVGVPHLPRGGSAAAAAAAAALSAGMAAATPPPQVRPRCRLPWPPGCRARCYPAPLPLLGVFECGVVWLCLRGALRSSFLPWPCCIAISPCQILSLTAIGNRRGGTHAERTHRHCHGGLARQHVATPN